MTTRFERDPDDILVKDPADILDYEFDWSDFPLGNLTISGSTWVFPAGLTKVSDGIGSPATSTIVRVSGGTIGTDYECVNTVTLSNTQVAEGVLVFRIQAVETPTSILVATAGGTTSNSYGTLLEANTYFASRPFSSDWLGATSRTKERALLYATLDLEQFDYVGEVVSDTQALKWPRQLSDTELIRTYPINVVPTVVKYAQFELAQYKIASESVAVEAGAVSELQIGSSVKVKYASGSTATVDTDVDFSGLPIAAARYLAGLRLLAVMA